MKVTLTLTMLPVAATLMPPCPEARLTDSRKHSCFEEHLASNVFNSPLGAPKGHELL